MNETNDTIFSGLATDEQKASPIQVAANGLIDFIIDIGALLLIYRFVISVLFPGFLRYNTFIVLLFIIATGFITRALQFLLLGKTMGMIITRIKLLDKNLQPLSARKKLMSIFRTRFSGVNYYKDK